MRKKFLTHFKSAFVVASLCCTAPIISSVNSADNTISPPEEGKNFSLSIPADPKEVLLELIYISPGSFSMGSPSLEIGRDEDETLHRVNISNGYWIGRFEITQEQYEPLMKENLAKWKGANIPAQSITYDKALEFCKKLTKAAQDKGLPQNYRFTLPTEAQWEYAARAGSISALGNGKTFTGKESCPNLNEIAWFSENSENKVHPIGLKQPNNWGIYDMQGNVAEWLDKVYLSNSEQEIDGYRFANLPYVYQIVMPDGTIRRAPSTSTSGNYVKYMRHQKYMDLINVGNSNDANQNSHYCDTQWIAGGTQVVCRSYGDAGAYGGVSFAYASGGLSDAGAGIGVRLAFRGVIVIAPSVSAYQALIAAY